MPTIAETLASIQAEQAAMHVQMRRTKRALAELTRWVQRWAGVEQATRIDSANEIADEQEGSGGR